MPQLRVEFEQIVELIRQLEPDEKARLLEWLKESAGAVDARAAVEPEDAAAAAEPPGAEDVDVSERLDALFAAQQRGVVGVPTDELVAGALGADGVPGSSGGDAPAQDVLVRERLAGEAEPEAAEPGPEPVLESVSEPVPEVFTDEHLLQDGVVPQADAGEGDILSERERSVLDALEELVGESAPQRVESSSAPSAGVRPGAGAGMTESAGLGRLEGGGDPLDDFLSAASSAAEAAADGGLMEELLGGTESAGAPGAGDVAPQAEGKQDAAPAGGDPLDALLRISSEYERTVASREETGKEEPPAAAPAMDVLQEAEAGEEEPARPAGSEPAASFEDAGGMADEVNLGALVSGTGGESLDVTTSDDLSALFHMGRMDAPSGGASVAPAEAEQSASPAARETFASGPDSAMEEAPSGEKTLKERGVPASSGGGEARAGASVEEGMATRIHVPSQVKAYRESAVDAAGAAADEPLSAGAGDLSVGGDSVGPAGSRSGFFLLFEEVRRMTARMPEEELRALIRSGIREVRNS